MNAYEILTGVGQLYVAAADTAAPLVNGVPGAAWTDLGETDGGVKVQSKQKIETFTTDQRTGPVEARRTEESLLITTKLVSGTLENVAQALSGQTVTDVAPGSGTIGTRNVGLYRGAQVAKFAILYRGKSPYGDFNAQYYVPRGFFSGDLDLEHKKGDMISIPIEFTALEDLNAVDENERFGHYSAEDAPAT
jgi:hypothetical protein